MPDRVLFVEAFLVLLLKKAPTAMLLGRVWTAWRDEGGARLGAMATALANTQGYEVGRGGSLHCFGTAREAPEEGFFEDHCFID